MRRRSGPGSPLRRSVERSSGLLRKFGEDVAGEVVGGGVRLATQVPHPLDGGEGLVPLPLGLLGALAKAREFAASARDVRVAPFAVVEAPGAMAGRAVLAALAAVVALEALA